jgi:hypothetical protein
VLGEAVEREVGSVAVDYGTLSSEEAAMGTQYRVGLTGELSDRWCAAYRMEQRGVAALARFRLDEGANSVGFSLKRNEGPADVIDMLDQLAEFVARVNREAAG